MSARTCQTFRIFLFIIHLCLFVIAEINECAEELDDCSVFADCFNLVESFSCVCKPGYEGDGKTCTCTCPFCILDVILALLYLTFVEGLGAACV